MKRFTQASVTLLILLLLFIPSSVKGDSNPDVVQIYYISGPEIDTWATTNVVRPASSPMINQITISLAVTGTYIYYDHWEPDSGTAPAYEADINTIVDLYSSTNLNGTQIWGNGLASDGCPPVRVSGSTTYTTCTDATDSGFQAGDVIVLSDTSVDVTRNISVDWDGGDKIGASASIAMAKLSWPTGGGRSDQSFAHEIYNTADWGTTYESPVGEDTNSPLFNDGSYDAAFQHCAISVMASKANTTLQYDVDGNGEYEGSTTLNEGGFYLLNNSKEGAGVRSTDAAKPIQALLMCGDVGSTTAIRDWTLIPTNQHGNNVVSAVGRDGDFSSQSGTSQTWLFLYSPSTNLSNIYVTCDKYNEADITVGPIAPRGMLAVHLDNWQGARCFTSDSVGITETDNKVFAIGTFDADTTYARTRHDWGWMLYPDTFLSTEVLVGMGFGKDPTNTRATNNSLPVWIVAACSETTTTVITADWNNDGTLDSIDLNGDGDILDTSINGETEVGSSAGITVDGLQVIVLYEPGADAEQYDQTGGRIKSSNSACPIIAAWGADPASATISDTTPALDSGTSIAPLRLLESSKTSSLVADIEPVGWSENDIAEYLISIHPVGGMTVIGVTVYDTIPAGTTYVANSTEYSTDGSTWTLIPDNASGTPFPLDAESGITISTGEITGAATWYVRFNVNVYGDTDTVVNCSTIYSNVGRTRACVNDSVSSNTDWGDLPEVYGTYSADSGPRHTGNGLILGATWDKETNGQPSTAATGDGDDEDGVVKFGTANDWLNGIGGFTVTVTDNDGTRSGCLNIWMDYDNDSVLEEVVMNELVEEGLNTVTVPLPDGWLPEPPVTTSFYFRFRLVPALGSGTTEDPYTCTGVSVDSTGYVYGGEVEDYIFELGTPTAAWVTFSATDNTDGILLSWEAFTEENIAGYILHRSLEDEFEGSVQLGDEIPTHEFPGNTIGGTYQYLDEDVERGVEYYYWLEGVALDGENPRTNAEIAILTWKCFLPITLTR